MATGVKLDKYKKISRKLEKEFSDVEKKIKEHKEEIEKGLKRSK